MSQTPGRKTAPKAASKAETQRRYADACATAHALDLIGDRWTLLVIRELMWGPRRFGDLKSSLPGISANVLTQRLGELEAAGILIHRKLPPPAAVNVYELTPWGLESEPIFQALGRWAARSPQHDPSLAFSAASLLLSMRTMLNGELAAGLQGRIGFELGERTFLAYLADGRLEIAPSALDQADVIFTGAPQIIAAALYGGQDLDALEAAGVLRVTGDRTLAARFVRLFPLPPKAMMPSLRATALGPK
jgi:DNA-binding HxlR family transcriptional regulator